MAAATATRPATRARNDAVLAAAVDLAREAARETADDAADVGEHLGVVVEGERLVSHRFACAKKGYRGWEWTVTLARVARARSATVCEVELLPGEDSILGLAWVPWSQRLRPGDIGPGDVLPFRADDPRLEPGWTPSGDPEVDEVAIDELALARVRVLSPQGRDEAAERWYRGSRGPTSSGSVSSSAPCSTCGFLVPLQGTLGTLFAVCANEWSPDDGKVVSLDHGCGAHSETDVEQLPTEWPAPDPLVDELSLVPLDLTRPAAAAGSAGDAPVADEPVDEPVADEPVADEPVADGPVASGADDDEPAVVDGVTVAPRSGEVVVTDDAPVGDAPLDDARADDVVSADEGGEEPASS